MKRTKKMFSRHMDVVTVSIKAQHLESIMNRQTYKIKSLACPTCLT